jgi:hypothetical protein
MPRKYDAAAPTYYTPTHSTFFAGGTTTTSDVLGELEVTVKTQLLLVKQKPVLKHSFNRFKKRKRDLEIFKVCVKASRVERPPRHTITQHPVPTPRKASEQGTHAGFHEDELEKGSDSRLISKVTSIELKIVSSVSYSEQLDQNSEPFLPMIRTTPIKNRVASLKGAIWLEGKGEESFDVSVVHGKGVGTKVPYLFVRKAPIPNVSPTPSICYLISNAGSRPIGDLGVLPYCYCTHL